MAAKLAQLTPDLRAVRERKGRIARGQSVEQVNLVVDKYLASYRETINEGTKRAHSRQKIAHQPRRHWMSVDARLDSSHADPARVRLKMPQAMCVMVRLRFVWPTPLFAPLVVGSLKVGPCPRLALHLLDKLPHWHPRETLEPCFTPESGFKLGCPRRIRTGNFRIKRRVQSTIFVD